MSAVRIVAELTYSNILKYFGVKNYDLIKVHDVAFVTFLKYISHSASDFLFLKN